MHPLKNNEIITTVKHIIKHVPHCSLLICAWLSPAQLKSDFVVKCFRHQARSFLLKIVTLFIFYKMSNLIWVLSEFASAFCDKLWFWARVSAVVLLLKMETWLLGPPLLVGERIIFRTNGSYLPGSVRWLGRLQVKKINKFCNSLRDMQGSISCFFCWHF